MKAAAEEGHLHNDVAVRWSVLAELQSCQVLLVCANPCFNLDFLASTEGAHVPVCPALSTNSLPLFMQMRELAKGDEYLRRYIHKHMSVACLAAVALSVLRCAALCCQQLILVAVSCNGPLCRRQQLAALHTCAHWLPTAAHQMPATRLHPASSPAPTLPPCLPVVHVLAGIYKPHASPSRRLL